MSFGDVWRKFGEFPAEWISAAVVAFAGGLLAVFKLGHSVAKTSATDKVEAAEQRIQYRRPFECRGG